MDNSGASALLLFLYLVFTALIGAMGSKRYIGTGWSVFFCVTLSPIIGFILTIISPKKVEGYESPIVKYRFIGIIVSSIFLLAGLLALIGACMGLGSSEPPFKAIVICIGFIGLGIYGFKK